MGSWSEHMGNHLTPHKQLPATGPSPPSVVWPALPTKTRAQLGTLCPVQKPV